MDNVAVKKLFNKLIIKLKALETKTPSSRGLVNKTQYYLDKQSLEKNIENADKKIHNTSLWASQKD